MVPVAHSEEGRLQQPAGILTFVFTDIEGSTRKWEDFPDVMRQALEHHDVLLRQTIEQQGGHVFKTVGDAFCSAFPSAPSAVAAVSQIQQALARQHWEPFGPLRVRVGLHTGPAQERGNDFFGPTVNRVARLQAIGHGGQTLLSEAAAALAQDSLPAETSLLDLGSHRLKDLGRPEHVFQLCLPGLPQDFPLVRSLQAFANNLPLQLTSFVGRDQDIVRVHELLAQHRLVTLTGAGGTGKTRLALQAAAERLEEYGDGVWFVDLAPLSDPALVPQSLADGLGVREEPGRSLTETLTDYLRSRQTLLLLDNCEHLLNACASLAQSLLQACLGVRLLATSREALNITGEQLWRVPTLSMPDPERLPLEEKDLGAVLLDYDAVRLFVERARLQRGEFVLGRPNAQAVSQICRRLDGIPLALELAAARVRVLSVEQIASRLDDRFRLLTGGSRTALPRQQTLRALIDWSYDLLNGAEKALLARLSVFAGGWTLEAAESVCAGDGVEDFEVLDLLTSLVDKSLVVYEEEAGGHGRYRLLETVRQYGRVRMQESGESDGVQGRAALLFLGLAEEAEPQLVGPQQSVWLERLETEHDNLRASLSWYEQWADGAEASLRLSGALWRFWDVRGHLTEGRQWLGRALERTKEMSEEGEGAALRAKALRGAGRMAGNQGDHVAARALQEESLAIQRRLGDQSGIANSLNNLGNVALDLGDYPAARDLYAESLAIQRRLGNEAGIATSVNNLGSVAYFQGDLAAARARYEETLAISRRLGDEGGISLALNNLANVALDQRDHGTARAMHEESLAIRRRLGDQSGIALSLNNLGYVASDLGDFAASQALNEESLAIRRRLGDERGIAISLNCLGEAASDLGESASARALLAESLALCPSLGDKRLTIYNLESLAGVALRQNQPSRVARLLGAASALREALGAPLTPGEQEKITRRVAAAREASGEEPFDAAWAEGGAMTLEQAVEYAFSDAGT